MNFIKENLQEVTTPNTITDLIVFEKGSNIPKKIKSNLFLNSLKKEFGGTISQSSTNNPTISIGLNTLDSLIELTYLDTGLYSITIEGGFNSTDYINIQPSVAGSVYVSWTDGNFRISTFNTSNVASNGILELCPIKIEMY